MPTTLPESSAVNFPTKKVRRAPKKAKVTKTGWGDAAGWQATEKMIDSTAA